MKKLVVLMLVGILAFSTVAYAVPSKTTEALVVVVDAASSAGVALASDFAVALTKESEAATAELKAVAAAVAAGTTPAAFFTKDATGAVNAEVETALKAALPANTDLSKLEMNEFAPLVVRNYDEKYVDITVNFMFVTQYKANQAIVAMVGIVTGTDAAGQPIVEWHVAQAKVENGLVKVTFTQDLLKKLEGKESMIAILSEPAV